MCIARATTWRRHTRVLHGRAHLDPVIEGGGVLQQRDGELEWVGPLRWRDRRLALPVDAVKLAVVRAHLAGAESSRSPIR